MPRSAREVIVDIEFRILGPLEVVADDGSALTIGGQRERSLLALLLTSPNQVVSSERLTTDLWGDRPPAGSTHALQVCVSRLRKSFRELGREGMLVTRPPGYLLQVEPGAVDAARFDELVAEGRKQVAKGEPEQAAETLRQALALWRGPALADVADATVAAAEAARLDEARLAAHEERIEADLACGRHAELVAELGHLTKMHPFRERLWGLRMLTLYRAGRQAEAIRTYHELQRLLADELGVEPSAALARLDVAILRQDPQLDLPSPEAGPAGGSTDERPLPTPPTTRYATSSGVKIAYQVVGDGPIDVVLVPGFVSNVELYWENPGWKRVFERISNFCRLVLWDKRGTGLSDPVSRVPTLDERADDLLAVMDATHSQRATLFGISEGGAMSLLFAATRPSRVRSLILYGATPRFVCTTDWDWGWSASQARELAAELEEQWGDAALLELFAPTEADNDVFRRGWGRIQRTGASPAMGCALWEAMLATDCRGVLPAITVPTLVLHRRGDRVAHFEAGRYIAQRIAGARFVELGGDNHLLPAGELEPILSEIETFVTGTGQPAAIDRILATVLCTEFVEPSGPSDDAEAHAPSGLMGRPQTLVRLQLQRFEGREIATTDRACFATFTAPSRALECADAIREALAPLGVSVRAGIHTGECEVSGGDVSGLAFRIADRVAALAPIGEVLATGTVKDLVAGSDLAFAGVGSHRLQGVPGDWPVFALAR